MEERKRDLVLMLGLYMCLHMLVSHVVSMQALILQGEWESGNFQHVFGEYGTRNTEHLEFCETRWIYRSIIVGIIH